MIVLKDRWMLQACMCQPCVGLVPCLKSTWQPKGQPHQHVPQVTRVILEKLGISSKQLFPRNWRFLPTLDPQVIIYKSKKILNCCAFRWTWLSSGTLTVVCQKGRWVPYIHISGGTVKFLLSEREVCPWLWQWYMSIHISGGSVK